jgi:hypothetical protein
MRALSDLQPILLSRPEIDAARWDYAVKHSCQQVIYAYSWYLDVVCDDWSAVVWPSKESYEVILPLPVCRKYGITIVQQPLFCQYLGFFYAQTVPPALFLAFFSVLNRAFPFISSYTFNPENSVPEMTSALDSSGLTVSTLFTHRLSLQQPFEEIYCAYKRDRKINLKRSGKYPWKVSPSTDIVPLIDLFKQNHGLTIPGGVDPKAYARLQRIFKQCRRHAHAELWYAGLNVNNAGILIVRSGGRAVYLFNAADQVGRDGNARSLLLNGYFEKYAGDEIQFDFESPENASIVAFYRSFNAAEAPFLSVCKNALPFPIRQIQQLRKRLFSWWGVMISRRSQNQAISLRRPL